MKNRLKDWTSHRLVEPSTHSSIAVLIVCWSLFQNSLTLEGVEWLPYSLAWATFHAVLGVTLKEGKGLF